MFQEQMPSIVQWKPKELKYSLVYARASRKVRLQSSWTSAEWRHHSAYNHPRSGILQVISQGVIKKAVERQIPQSDKTGTEEENFSFQWVWDSQQDESKKAEILQETPVESSNGQKRVEGSTSLNCGNRILISSNEKISPLILSSTNKMIGG